MSFNQRTYLHTPARTTAVVEDYERQHKEETEQLDFKSIVWDKGKKPQKTLDELLEISRSMETAKDVAAFANHLGGDIIIGINDKDGTAGGKNPIPNADIDEKMDNIRDWLMLHLRPRSFASLVEIEPIAAFKPDHSVLVVSVPPSPDLIGVEDKESDIMAYQFPIRIGKRTRWLTFEEIMEKTATSTRGIYIRLQRFVDELGGPISSTISFCSPVLISTRNIFMSKPAILSIYGHCESLSPDVIKVKMQGTGGEIQIPPTILMVTPHGPERVSVPPDHTVSIPLELIRAAWKETKDTKAIGQGEHITLALDAKVVWRDEGQFWELMFG